MNERAAAPIWPSVMLHRIWSLYEFASEATLAAIWAGACALVALGAIYADRRRMKRRHIDRVGFMPWTGISMLALFIAAALLLLAIKGWASG